MPDFQEQIRILTSQGSYKVLGVFPIGDEETASYVAAVSEPDGSLKPHVGVIFIRHFEYANVARGVALGGGQERGLYAGADTPGAAMALSRAAQCCEDYVFSNPPEGIAENAFGQAIRESDAAIDRVLAQMAPVGGAS